MDSKKLIEEIRQEIRTDGLRADFISFDEVRRDVIGESTEFHPEVLSVMVINLKELCHVNPFPPISGNPIAVFIKKVIRKLTKFYITPLVEQQNHFNQNTASVINQIELYISESEKKTGSAALPDQTASLPAADNTSIDIDNINVEDIMTQIRTEIFRKGYNESALSFCDNFFDAAGSQNFSYGDMQRYLHQMNCSYILEPDREITGNPLKRLFKRAVRKTIHFYIKPIADQQTQYNGLIVQTLNTVSDYITQNISR